MTNQFNIPVVIFIFKRMKAVEIIKQISKVQPKKIYILSDNGRNDDEREQVKKCRNAVEAAIDWNCEVVKKYAESNIGVFGNIGLGALWVFEREEKAIFLEDDNLPEITFFDYCKELLEMYEKNEQILWVCGTNYLGEYEPEDKSSYVFTNHLLPCGWASWSWKFKKYYDTTLSLADDKTILKRMKKNYYNNRIFKQYMKVINMERQKIKLKKRPVSWDYHMEMALKANTLLGISPGINQIRNIGVDDDSIHGGNSLSYRQIKKMCNMPSNNIQLPLIHPKRILKDVNYDREVCKILLYPIEARIKQSFIINPIIKLIRKLFKIPSNVHTKQYFFGKKR